MSASYPLLVDLREARVLVVGGGAVAGRRVRSLVAHGGRPEIVAPEVTPGTRRIVETMRLTWRERVYEPGDARGCTLVFAATDSREVNAAVAREAREQGAWVSVADDSERSTVQVPAALREGEVTVAVSTGGASPLLARRLVERLRVSITPGLGRTAARLRATRARVRSRWPLDEERRRAFWFTLITDGFLDCAIAGEDAEVESRIEACLSRS